MATQFTTEQNLPVSFKIVDGRGRAAEIDGDPVVASSDETVARMSADGVKKNDDGSYGFSVESVAPGTARLSVTADADRGEGVQEIVGVLEVEVTQDERSNARVIELTAGEATDEPV